MLTSWRQWLLSSNDRNCYSSIHLCLLGPDCKRSTKILLHALTLHVTPTRPCTAGFRPQITVLGHGWIVQERILSPRVLHFAARGIVWECCKGQATQSSPYLPNDLYISDRLKPRPGSITAVSVRGVYNILSSVKRPPHLPSIWYGALKTYSKTKLTEPNIDKLIALRGISKRIADFLGDTLWHGFLSSKLLHTLCWYAGCRQESTRGACSYRVVPDNDHFPSWRFVRSNHRWRFLESLPRVDPLLRIIDDPMHPNRLCCIGSIVPLEVQMEAGHPRSQRLVHVLTLFGLAANPEAHGKRLIGSYRVSESCFDPYAFHARLDHFVASSDGKLSWLLLPVCWQPSRHRIGNVTPESAHLLDTPDLNFGLTHFAGLLLQPKPNGDLVRVELLYNNEFRSRANLLVLLTTVQKAEPRFLMIS